MIPCSLHFPPMSADGELTLLVANCLLVHAFALTYGYLCPFTAPDLSRHLMVRAASCARAWVGLGPWTNPPPMLVFVSIFPCFFYSLVWLSFFTVASNDPQVSRYLWMLWSFRPWVEHMRFQQRFPACEKHLPHRCVTTVVVMLLVGVGLVFNCHPPGLGEQQDDQIIWGDMRQLLYCSWAMCVRATYDQELREAFSGWGLVFFVVGLGVFAGVTRPFHLVPAVAWMEHVLWEVTAATRPTECPGCRVSPDFPVGTGGASA